MKVLFLDIDGVVNSDRSAFALGGYPHDFTPPDLVKFDHVALGLVRRLCRDLNVQIVLSSTWRYHFPVWKVAEGLDLPIFDCTPMPEYCEYANRGHEVAAWLTKHPEVTSWAIVDDINAFLPGQQDRFVQTNDKYGLTLENYARLAQILGSEDYMVIVPGTMALNWDD